MSSGEPGAASSPGFGAGIWLGVLAVAAAIGAAMYLYFPRASAAESVVLPAFELESSTGGRVRSEDLRGRPYVVEFFFTSCPICALLNEGFQRLQQKLPREVRLVSISVDPEHDTPEVLRAYAERHGADPERWLFLRGDMQRVNELIVRCGFARAESPAEHSLRFVLFDADGGLVKTYAPIEFGEGEKKGLSERELRNLVEDATRLLEAARR